MISGFVLILFMPLDPVLRILLSCAWLGENTRECRRLVRGAARVRLIKLDALGNIAAITADGRSEPLTLLSGSIVLSRLAWLRVKFPDGSRYAELLRGDPARDLEWHRLQLLWRHGRAAFGRQDGS